MTPKDSQDIQVPPRLRERAEAALRASPAELARMTPEEIQHLVHELQVHQIELSMQNEEMIRAQLELAESRDRLADLYDLAPVGYLTLDPGLRILEANLTVASLLGVERSHLVGKSLTAFTARDSQDALYHHHRASLAGEGRQSAEFELRRADGSTFPVQMDCIPVSGPAGSGRLVHCTISDISERWQTGQRLDYQLRLAEAIADCAGEAIFVVDRQCRITYANGQSERLFGYARDELLGQSLHESLHNRYPDGRPYPREQCPNCRVFADGEQVRAQEAQFWRKDGSPLWVACSNAALDLGGERIGAVLVAHDLSQIREAEHRLREADERKDAFLATLAHELRNPLAPIRSAVGVLRLDGSPAAVAGAALEIVERQVRHMVRLIDDLMDVSRINRGRLRLRFEPVELAAVLGQAVEATMPHLEAAGHSLSLALPSEPLWLEADPVRLAQVFLNVLNNASKFTPPGGAIRLAATRQGDEAVVTVTDTGVGILPQDLPRLFQMFAQIDASRGQGGGGLGIGLALAKTLVELHGGRIEARSEGPGKGTELRVRLPVLAQATAAPSPGEAGAAAPALGAALRVLVADDNRDCAESLAILLRAYGYQVETADDGLAAVELAGRWQPDLALLDIGMPRLDGYGACRRIRALPAGKAITILALTGWGKEEDRNRSREAGFDGHLVKPVDPVQLLRLLAEPRAAESGPKLPPS